MNEEINKLPRILFGIDFGTKRIGVAVGQTVTRTSRPLDTIPAKNGVPNWDIFDKLITKWQPDAIVVGIPLNMDGTEQRLTQIAREFATELKKRYQLIIYTVDERLTTKDARERLFDAGGYKALADGQVDRVAAQLILQNWFAESMSGDL